MSSQVLERLAENLWVASRNLPLAVGDVGARMTVIRVAGELLLHSPVSLDAPLRSQLETLGRVRWLVAPNKVHSLFMGEAARAYPEAELFAAPGLAEKRKDLSFQHVLQDGAPGPWGRDVEHLCFEGVPTLNEVVFLHRPSRTLVLTDLAFHVERGAPNRARAFHWLVGAVGRFGPHRLVRMMIRDRAAARRSRDRVLAWDFERVVVSHGSVLEHGGHARCAEAFAFLGPSPAAG